MPSKLKPCEGEENQVETYLKDANLEDYIQEINYKAMRKEEIQ